MNANLQGIARADRRPIHAFMCLDKVSNDVGTTASLGGQPKVDGLLADGADRFREALQENAKVHQIPSLDQRRGSRLGNMTSAAPNALGRSRPMASALRIGERSHLALTGRPKLSLPSSSLLQPPFSGPDARSRPYSTRSGSQWAMYH
jgi:hypothetical protein